MRRLRRQFRPPRGIALPLTLMVLVLLSTLALALLSMSAYEPLISRNLVSAEQARFVAEAGLEWVFNSLRASSDWDALLLGADPARGALVVVDSPLPARPPAEGVFTVRVRNDSLAGDALLTGVPPDAGGPSDDTNSLLIVTSVGTINTGTRTVQAVVQRVPLPGIPAALAFPGGAATLTARAGFEIDGNDWNSDATAGPCPATFGISVSALLPTASPGANEAAVEAALADLPPTNVKGKRQNPTGPPYGPNSIAPVPGLTPSEVQSFVARGRKADLVLDSSGPAGLTLSEIGTRCASNWSSSDCWGTPDRPKVVYVKGNPDPTSGAPGLQISGNSTGHGVLIIEDGELSVTGSFLWHGLIIATGSRVGLTFLGGGDQSVYGAIVLNTEAGAGKGLSVGSAKIRHSCQALRQAQLAQKLVTVRNWGEVSQ